MAEYGVADKIADSIIKNHIDLDRFAVGVKEKVVGILEKAQQEIIGKVAEIDPDAPTITKWKQERLEKLNQKISDILDTSYKEIDGTTMSALKDIAGISGDGTAGFLNAAIGANIFDVTLTPELLNSIATKTLIDGHIIGEWWQKQSADTKQRLIGQMNQAMQQIQVGLVEGESIGEMIRRIRGTKLTPGVMSVSKREAAALVRTSVHQVVQEVRKETYRQNEDVLKGYEVVATLDKRTTPLCRALDRKQFDMGFKPIGHSFAYPAGGPPFHWNCRTTLIPITKSYRELMADDSPLSAKKKDLLSTTPIGPRASMGGQVQGRIDYNEWLLAQPEDVQLDVLGPTRLQLWKENKLAMQDMVHQDGRPFTIQELKDSIGKGAPQFREKQMLENLKATAGTFETMDDFQMYIDTMPEGKFALRLIDEAGETPESIFLKSQKTIAKIREVPKYTWETVKIVSSDSLGKFKIHLVNASKTRAIDVNEVGKMFAHVYNRLPELSNIAGDLPVYLKFVNAPHVLGHAWGTYRRDELIIKVATKGRRSAMGKLKAGGWSIAGDSIPATTLHEYGHHIWYRLSSQDRIAWQKLFDGKEKQWWEKKVSLYGSRKYKEAFAEAFSAYANPNYIEGMLPKEIETMFAKMFKVAPKENLIAALDKSEKALIDFMKLSADETIMMWKEANGIFAEIMEGIAGKEGMTADEIVEKVKKIDSSHSLRQKYWKQIKALIDEDAIAREAVASLEKEGMLPGDFKLRLQAIKGRMAELKLGTVKPIAEVIEEGVEKTIIKKTIIPEVVIPPKPVIPDILAGSEPIYFKKGMKLPPGVFTPISKPAMNPLPPEIPSPSFSAGSLRRTAGSLIIEPDGKVWVIVDEKGKMVLPKGKIDEAFGLHEGAEKTAFRLMGLDSDIVGFLGDYKRTSTAPRFYIARRTGGVPATGLANRVVLCPINKLESLITDEWDRIVIRDFVSSFKQAEALGKGNIYDGFKELAKEFKYKTYYEELIASPEIKELGLVVPEGLGYKATAEFIESSIDEATKAKVLEWSTGTGAERKAFEELKDSLSKGEKPVSDYKRIRDRTAILKKEAEEWLGEVELGTFEDYIVKTTVVNPTDDIYIRVEKYKSEYARSKKEFAKEIESLRSSTPESSDRSYIYHLMRKEALSENIIKKFDATDEWEMLGKITKRLDREKEIASRFFHDIAKKWGDETYGGVVSSIRKDHPSFLNYSDFRKRDLFEEYGREFIKMSDEIERTLLDEEIKLLYMDRVPAGAPVKDRYKMLKEIVEERKSAKPIIPEAAPAAKEGVGKFIKDYDATDARAVYAGIKRAAITGKMPAPATRVAKLWEDLDSIEKKRIIDVWIGKKVEISPTFMEKYYSEVKVRAKISSEIEPTTIKKVLPVDTDTVKLKITDFSQYAAQEGSNPGGFYALKDNPADRWYFKFSDDTEKLNNELLAIKLYKLAGVEVPDLAIVVDEAGKRKGIASRIIDGVEKNRTKLLSGSIKEINENFMVDAWLANWDVVGGAFDNLVIKDGIRAIRIDVGGALRYRARGELKGSAFGSRVSEIDTLRDASKNPNTAQVFKGLTKQQMKVGASKVLSISDSDIRALVEEYGPSSSVERAKLYNTLIERKKHIAELVEELEVATKPPPPLPPLHELSKEAIEFGGRDGVVTRNRIDKLIEEKKTLANEITYEDIAAARQKIAADMRVCTNIPLEEGPDSKVYKALFKEPELKNQLLRGEGGKGSPSPYKGGVRDEWEMRYSGRIFEKDPNYQKMKHREKFASTEHGRAAARARAYYGSIFNSNNITAANQYGDVMVFFKKEVIDRATFTLMNTSGYHPGHGDMGNKGNLYPLLKRLSGSNFHRLVKEGKSINQLGFEQSGYIEAQIYGELLLNRDVDFMVWTGYEDIPQYIRDFAERWNLKIYTEKEFIKLNEKTGL